MGKVKDWMMDLEASMIGNISNTEKWRAMKSTQPESTRASVLNEANQIVNGQRADTYGGPEDSFKTIAGLWEAYSGTKFSPADVAVFLALLKVARLKNSPNHRDSWVDLAGYAACGAECGLK